MRVLRLDIEMMSGQECGTKVLRVNLEEGWGARVEWDCLGRIEGEMEMEMQRDLGKG
jgi:hypothetical protein